MSEGVRVTREFRARDGRVVGRLEPYEAGLLRGLVGDVVSIVRDDDPGNAVTRRLFPDASPDPEVAADVRDLIHDDLREAKLANARAVLESLDEGDGALDLDAETAEQWLSALNDLRLALGTAIGVTEDMEYDEDDPEQDVYEWLGYLQYSLIDALSAGGVQR